MGKVKELVFERDGSIYIVSPVAPFTPADNEIDELSFADSLKKMAPNEHLLWMRGQYVEADRANENGQMWDGHDLEFASLTPVFMPVTVMHDPRSAVGVIADTRLVEPPDAPRRRIDNTLAIWTHRFPDIAEEVMSNYRAGTLMQSQECRPQYYDCGECGTRYPVLPDHAERENWCEHLRGETSAANARPVRRLGNVTFTGTGLIFGSRGSRGALDTAHLEVFRDEVAEFHSAAHTTSRTTPKRAPRRTRNMEIEDTRYQELVTAEAKLKELEPKLTEAEEKAGKVPDLERKVDELEIGKKDAETARDEEKSKREGLEERSRSTTLATERTSKLGDAFKAKLPESIKTRLDEQAKTLSDEDWTARLDELAELTGVKPDEAAASDAGVTSTEETSRTQLAAGASTSGGTPSRAAVGAVLGGLLPTLPGAPRKPEPATK